MTPQLTKIAECLSESHAREIKLARCLAESLKRIQTLESSAKTKDTKAKATELRFNAAVRDLAEQLAKQNAENEELIRKMEEAIKVEFPAQLAALKAEFATPAAQAAAPQSFNPRGAYEPGEKYKPFDYVSSNGSSYIALVENPTQPPSKRSKQWMLVAARGAGGGGVTGLGTAAYRDVGQNTGNLVELDSYGSIVLGDGDAGGAIRLRIMDISTIANTISFGAVPSAYGSISLTTPAGDGILANITASANSANRTYTLPDASGTIALTAEVKSANFTAALDGEYVTTATLTVTDPTPAEGKGFSVFVRNGTATVGGTAYATAGTTVRRVFHSGAWANYTGSGVSVAVGDITGLGTGVATALAVNAGAAGAFVRTTDTATTTTAGVVGGIGIDLPQAPVGTNVAYISQVGAIGRNFSSFLYTDFLTGGFSGSPGSASDGFIFGTGTSGTGASVGKLNTTVSGRAGILLLTTGTTATGYAAIDTFNSGNTYRYDDGQTVFESLIRLPVLSDATNEYVFSIGGGPQNNGVVGNDGAFFTYNRASFGANWQAVSKRNGSQTTTNSNVAVVADSWFRLALIVNATGTSITYYINGTLVATITTNIQTGGPNREGCILVKTAGTTSVTANIDYYFLGKTFTTAR